MLAAKEPTMQELLSKMRKTNITYNFKNKGDNVHHEILLPEYADKKFLSVSEFMNEVEKM